MFYMACTYANGPLKRIFLTALLGSTLGCALPSHIHSPERFEAAKLAAKQSRILATTPLERQIRERDAKLEKKSFEQLLRLDEIEAIPFIDEIVQGKLTPTGLYKKVASTVRSLATNDVTAFLPPGRGVASLKNYRNNIRQLDKIFDDLRVAKATTTLIAATSTELTALKTSKPRGTKKQINTLNRAFATHTNVLKNTLNKLSLGLTKLHLPARLFLQENGKSKHEVNLSALGTSLTSASQRLPKKPGGLKDLIADVENAVAAVADLNSTTGAVLILSDIAAHLREATDGDNKVKYTDAEHAALASANKLIRKLIPIPSAGVVAKLPLRGTPGVDLRNCSASLAGNVGNPVSSSAFRAAVACMLGTLKPRLRLAGAPKVSFEGQREITKTIGLALLGEELLKSSTQHRIKLESQRTKLGQQLKVAKEIRGGLDKARKSFLDAIKLGTSVPATEAGKGRLAEASAKLKGQIRTLTEKNDEASRALLDTKKKDLAKVETELEKVRSQSIESNVEAGVDEIRSYKVLAGLRSLGTGFDPIVKFWTNLDAGVKGANRAGFIDPQKGMLRYTEFLLEKINYDLALIKQEEQYRRDKDSIEKIRDALAKNSLGLLKRLERNMRERAWRGSIADIIARAKKTATGATSAQSSFANELRLRRLFQNVILPALYLTVNYPANRDVLARKDTLAEKTHKNAQNEITLGSSRRMIQIATATLESYEAGGVTPEQIGQILQLIEAAALTAAVGAR